MPIYEYQCEACHARFERMRPMADRLTAAQCPACGSERAALALSVPGHVGEGGAPVAVGPARPCGGGSCGCMR